MMQGQKNIKFIRTAHLKRAEAMLVSSAVQTIPIIPVPRVSLIIPGRKVDLT